MLPVFLALLTVLVTAAAIASTMFGSKKLDVKGKFCYIPGGSAGLGKALAAKLVRRGAHVVIVARDGVRSAATIAELKALAPDADQQKIFAVSADLTKHETSVAALNEACAAFGGQAPDYAFLCAGFAKPQLFVDTTPEDLQSGLDGVYWVAAWTAHAVTQMMIRQRRKGTITIVSSFLGYMSFAGYASYSPAKFALRGLADSLRSELAIFDITVHLYMPAGILSPGYENEQRTKPALTKKIEEDDKPITPELAAAKLVKGIEAGNYQITNDLTTELARTASASGVPGNGLLDWPLAFIAAVGLPIWRILTERTIMGYKDEIYKTLEARGFFKD